MVNHLLRRVPGARTLANLVVRGTRAQNPRAALLATLPKNAVCAEIGVHKGDFSAQVLQALHPRKLHLIDPWKYEESDTYKKAWYGGMSRGGQRELDERHDAVRARFAREIRSGVVSIHRGPSSDVLTGFPDGYFDWVYIDGNHLYEFVKEDLELSFRTTKPGGHITGDDYGESGWWQGGVKKAVDEFVRERPVRLVAIQNRQFVLRRSL